MAVKLADTLAPMGDFEIAQAKDISVVIGDTVESLQEAVDNGDIGGGGSSIDDENISDKTTWSSKKIDEELENKANDEDLENYVPIQQDAEEKGKALVVGEDGKIELKEIEGGEGKPEIYVGDTEPTDENIELWIDTSEEVEPIYPKDVYYGIEKYSDDETIIGEYNGKPLYRAKINFTDPNGYNDISALHLEKMVDLKIFFGNANQQCIANPDYANGGFFCRGFLDNANSLYLGHSADNTISKVVMEYTKTTDAEGSFEPSMITGELQPAKEIYSENEIAVGTWIDGSTLYRKVVACGAATVGTKEIAHNITNLGKVVSIGGYGYSSQWNQYIPLPFINTNGYTIQLDVIGAKVRVITKTDIQISETYVVLEYTKTN